MLLYHEKKNLKRKKTNPQNYGLIVFVYTGEKAFPYSCVVLQQSLPTKHAHQNTLIVLQRKIPWKKKRSQFFLNFCTQTTSDFLKQMRETQHTLFSCNNTTRQSLLPSTQLTILVHNVTCETITRCLQTSKRHKFVCFFPQEITKSAGSMWRQNVNHF